MEVRRCLLGEEDVAEAGMKDCLADYKGPAVTFDEAVANKLGISSTAESNVIKWMALTTVI